MFIAPAVCHQYCTTRTVLAILLVGMGGDTTSTSPVKLYFLSGPAPATEGAVKNCKRANPIQSIYLTM